MSDTHEFSDDEIDTEIEAEMDALMNEMDDRSINTDVAKFRQRTCRVLRNQMIYTRRSPRNMNKYIDRFYKWLLKVWPQIFPPPPPVVTTPVVTQPPTTSDVVTQTVTPDVITAPNIVTTEVTNIDVVEEVTEIPPKTEEVVVKKAALLIGINYIGTSSALSGCINDVDNVRILLKRKYGFVDSEIRFLSDGSNASNNDKPTKRNILQAMDRLANSGADIMWFHYSGHGSHQRDYSGDEKDGQDETLVPSDYASSGVITDDDVYKRMVSPLKKEQKLIAFFDCCHSGTQMDLPYIYINNKFINASKHFKNINNLPNVVMISGCQDHDTSADAYGLITSDLQEEGYKKTKYTGAMTTDFITVLDETDYSLTCSELLKRMQKYMKVNKFAQVPQLCTTRKGIKTMKFPGF